MKTNVKIIKKLARLGVLNTEYVKNKNDNDIILENLDGTQMKVITDGITDEDLPLMIYTKQLEMLKSINFFVKTTFILGVIAAVVWILSFMIQMSTINM